MESIEKEGSDYGKIDLGKGKKVMVEFVSANPTGPMHMGKPAAELSVTVWPPCLNTPDMM